jgi:hypothetical protein
MSKIKGKKTYITGAITIILLAIGHFQNWDQATIEKIIGGAVVFLGIFIRSGIASSLGISEEAATVAKSLEGDVQKALIKARAIKTGAEVFNSAPSVDDIEKVLGLADRIGIGQDQDKFLKDNLASWLMKIAADPDESPKA